MKKVCSRCKIEKALDEFPIKKYPKRTWIYSRCYECTRETEKIKMRKWRLRRRLDSVTPLRPA